MRSRLPPLAAVALLLLSACRDPKIASYRVPKEKDPVMPAATSTASTPATPTPASPGASMANSAHTTPDGPGLIWSAPAHWTAKPASAMRKASYAISGEAGATADFSITAFPGDVGGDLANVNRWRGQIQLAPLAAAELATATTHVDSNNLHLTVADFTGGTPAAPLRVLGAIIPVNGATWFFKLSGPAPLVAREQAAFAAFLQTVRAAGATP
ncbi:MAG: hypothetical protein H7343_17935 [Undibacterium sp.]|nr:hypothetical protein [Opitutaceae bacterium]